MICTDNKKIHFSGGYLARMSISMSMYKQKDACKIWDFTRCYWMFEYSEMGHCYLVSGSHCF